MPTRLQQATWRHWLTNDILLILHEERVRMVKVHDTEGFLSLSPIVGIAP